MFNKGQILFLLLFISLSSCEAFEKDYYEKISGMKFPSSIQVIETVENGEFVTTTSFKVDSVELDNFRKKYKFEKKDKVYPPSFFGQYNLKKLKPDFNNLQDLYFKTDSKGKNSWFYIVDLKKHLLWAEIQYPDWGGT